MFGMAGRRGGTPAPPEDFEERNIVDIDVAEEMRGSYLEYAYSVIYSRALPGRAGPASSRCQRRNPVPDVTRWGCARTARQRSR